MEAVVELHEEVGPAFTTISAIAERAGVQRLTVYRHFPDEPSLFQACSTHWMDRHPPPDPAAWSGIQDPGERARTALTALYGYFRNGAPMISKIIRDADHVEALQPFVAPYRSFLAEVAGGLAAGWGVEGERQRALRAAAGLAVRFETWRSLEEEGLQDEPAAALMARFLACVADGAPPGT